MSRRLFILFLLIITGLCGFAQQERQIPAELLDAIFSQIAENRETEDIDQTQVYEDLQRFAENPINLNKTNKEELEKLQFLTDIQIENLLYYLYQYGPMESIYELKLVDGLYGQDIRNLLPFVFVGKGEKQAPPLKWKNILKYGKQELLVRTDRCVETKEGYKSDPEKQYVGNPFYYSLKYRFRYSNRVLFGLTGEKDAGEQTWGNYNKGFDFYSGYLQLNDIGKFKTIVVGDFSACFGQGLVMCTNYGFGKSGMVLNVETRNEGLKKCGSTDEYNFLRGVGGTVKLGKLELTAFYSNKMIDGDTLSGSFSAMKVDGIHRTVSDLSKKNTVNMQVMGTHASFTYKTYNVGMTLTNLHLDNALTPTLYPYNFYYFSGKEQTSGSIDYKLRWRRLFFFGETAITDKLAPATLNGLSINPMSTVSLVMLYRYYAPKYNVLFANAFGEGSQNNNEEGLYLGAEVHPFRCWKFSAYGDSYRFPWLKYGIDKPSTGYDVLFQADCVPKRDVSMYWRFRFEQKADNVANDTATTPTISNYDRGSLRYVLQYAINEHLKLRNTLEGTYSKKADDAPTTGFLLGQDLSYSFAKTPLSFDLRYEFFDAMNYENRIYCYEKDILYAFSIPALYGEGSRYYLNVKYKLLSNLSLYFKIGQTVYINQEVIGTGLEEIVGNRKTDMRLLVRWEFCH